MYAPSYVWAKVISHLEQQLTEITVSAWFDDTEVIEMTEERLTVYSPSDFRQQIIRDRCGSYIREYLEELMGHSMQFEVLGQHDLRLFKEARHTPTARMNPQFTFDNFISGKSNRMALMIAKAVAGQPGQEKYNPFFLYGPPGVGKTHLLYAIANTLLETRPELQVTYIRAEQFTSELIWALHSGDKEKFKQKYRKTDVLLVDDIQFIAGKESTQEEFFNTFNELYEHGKQIVISSDRKPCDMATLEDRLRSRFDASVPIEILPPDYDTRLQVVRAKAKSYNLPMDEESMAYIARRLADNIRLVEGGMKKIRAFHELSGMALTGENIRKTIEDIRYSQQDRPVTVGLVIRHVCKYYGIDEDLLKGPQRSRGIAQPRQIAMYLTRQLVNMSVTDIGKVFGGRDRATVLHSIKKVEQELKLKDNALDAVIRDITSNIESTPY